MAVTRGVPYGGAPSKTSSQHRPTPRLAMLANAGRNGVTQPLLSAHGFSAAVIADLVNQGLATLTREQVKAGGKTVEVGKVRTTDAGRDALAAKR